MFRAVGAIQLGKGAHVVFLYFPQPWRTRKLVEPGDRRDVAEYYGVYEMWVYGLYTC